VDLSSRFNQVLQVCPRKEIAKVDKLAMSFVLHIDNTPAVLPTPYRSTIDDNIVFGTNDSEWNDLLENNSKLISRQTRLQQHTLMDSLS
jgi:hypothetical protein